LNWELGMRNAETRALNWEFGMRTRRRPIGRDYAAAKDAECGNQRSELGMRN